MFNKFDDHSSHCVRKLFIFFILKMHAEPLASKLFRNPMRMNAAQKTSLITAWMLIKTNLQSHARNIFAHFFELNPDYLRLFDNNTLHSHSESVLQLLTALIDDGLQNAEVFDCIIEEIVKRHEHISRQDVMKLNEIINGYVLNVLKRHMTRTLREAIENLFVMIESRFQDAFDVTNEEI